VSRDVEGHYFRVQYVANVLLELLTPHYRKCTRKQRIDVDHCWLILSGVFYEYTKLCLPQQFVARHHPKVPTVETSHTSFLFLESWRDVVWPHPHLLLSSVRAADGLCQVWGRFPPSLLYVNYLASLSLSLSLKGVHCPIICSHLFA